MFSSGAGGLSTGGSSCPVMSSYEKSPSCISRSPRSHVFRNVFMGCLVVFSKRPYLGPCTLDFRTTVCNPNRGQRVADYYTQVPNSAGRFFFFCVRSTSPKPQRLSNVQFALVVFRSVVVQGSFPSTLVIQCQAWLVGQCVP